MLLKHWLSFLLPFILASIKHFNIPKVRVNEPSFPPTVVLNISHIFKKRCCHTYVTQSMPPMLRVKTHVDTYDMSPNIYSINLNGKSLIKTSGRDLTNTSMFMESRHASSMNHWMSESCYDLNDTSFWVASAKRPVLWLWHFMSPTQSRKGISTSGPVLGSDLAAAVVSKEFDKKTSIAPARYPAFVTHCGLTMRWIVDTPWTGGASTLNLSALLTSLVYFALLGVRRTHFIIVMLFKRRESASITSAVDVDGISNR